MTLRGAASQQEALAASVILGGLEGTSLTSEERRAFSRVPLAGFTLFQRNIPDPYSGLVHLTGDLQALRPRGSPPLILAIDQEGGRVRRIKQDFPDRGAPLGLEGAGRTDPQALAAIRAHSYEVASALGHLGITLNFAPVVDIYSDRTHDSIGDRCWGRTAAEVIARAGAYIEGHQAAGVGVCLKHFPGQGSAHADSHLGNSVVERFFSDLQAEDLAPYRALPHNAVMMSHALYPHWPEATTRASADPAIIKLARSLLRPRGIVLSDDMNMGAVAQDSQPWLEEVTRSLRAGCDGILICRGLDRCMMAIDFVAHAATRDDALAAGLRRSAARLLEFRQRKDTQAVS